MTSRKSRQARKRKYTRHPIDRFAPRTRFARSDEPDPATPAIRDPQPFHDALAAGERFAELLPDVDELLAGDVDDEP